MYDQTGAHRHDQPRQQCGEHKIKHVERVDDGRVGNAAQYLDLVACEIVNNQIAVEGEHAVEAEVGRVDEANNERLEPDLVKYRGHVLVFDEHKPMHACHRQNPAGDRTQKETNDCEQFTGANWAGVCVRACEEPHDNAG